MLREAVQFLVRNPGGIYLDATVGAGGHTRGILESAGSSARVVAMDQDRQALELAKEQLEDVAKQMTFTHGNFRELDRLLTECGVGELDGALLDLGLSSMQVDSATRGFSFRQDGPLDMRMNSEGAISAQEIVNHWPEHELADILFQYGEERLSRRIAHSIVASRPITTTDQLAHAVMKAMPRGRSWQKIHPATRTFQALRIVVNQELPALQEALPQIMARLKPGARLVVISYHSLEDRIVKRAFLAAAKAGTFSILTRKPLSPREEEVQENARSRSAHLRAGERVVS